MLKLALRNIFRHRFRTAMTLAGIVMGVTGLVLSGGFVQDIYAQLAEALIHSQFGHIQVAHAGYFTVGSRSPEKYAIANPNELRDKISALPEVIEVLERSNFSGLLNNGRTDWPIVGEGVEPAKEAKLGSFMRIVAGRQLADGDRFGILVGQDIAKALKLAPGDRVTLLANTAEGALNTLEFEVVGVFESFSKDFDARAVRIPLRATQELLGSQRVNALVVALKHTEDTGPVAARLAAMLDPTQFEMRTWDQLSDFYDKTVALYSQQFGFLQVIILAMVLLTVANSVNMSVFERIGEFGTMMALGKRSSQVLGLIVAEGTLLGLIGSFLGIALGVGLAVGISSIGIPMPPPPNANLGYTAVIRIVPGVLATAFSVGFLATTLAAMLSAVRISRTPVADALRANV